MSISDPHNCDCGKETTYLCWKGVEIMICDKCRLVFMFVDNAWLGWFNVTPNGRLPGEGNGSP